MPHACLPYRFADLAAELPVIDVRSPAEYAKGHISRAISIPLFNNEERAIVGTLYVQSGREHAIRQGLEIAGGKFKGFIEAVETAVPGKELALHCWRGGMRSESLAWFFERLGYKVHLLEGGYKAYRRFIREEFLKPLNLILLGGYTGSGKTDILQALSASGEQCIDLEALARHKGSVFGNLGQEVQPSTEQFENDLFCQWHSLQVHQPVWLEHESNRIGKVFLPETFFSAMLNGTLLKIILPLKIRIQRLVKEYAGFDKKLLEGALLSIRTEMGTHSCKLALSALEKDDFEQVASLALDYYDKTYTHALAKRPVRTVEEVFFDSDDAIQNAQKLHELVKERFPEYYMING